MSRHTQDLPIDVVICNSYLSKDSFLIICPEVRTIEYSAKTSTYNSSNSNTGLMHLLNSPTKRLDLQYNILICITISASSQLLLVKVKPRYLIESVYIIGNVFINSGGNDNL